MSTHQHHDPPQLPGPPGRPGAEHTAHALGTALGLGNWTTVGIAAFPLNRWLVSRGMGHAVLHAYHR